MRKFRDFTAKFLKTNFKFETSTFEIGYMKSFVKIIEGRGNIFWPKTPKTQLGLMFEKRKLIENSRFFQF